MNKIKTKLNKIWAFTLIELVFVATILCILLPSIFSMYRFIIKSNKEINARQSAIQAWYEFFERLNILMQDYSIDYEEYYNRQMVWCVNSGWTLLTGDDFRRDVGLSWYCSEFTAYWNNNSTQSRGNRILTWRRDLYHCSSEARDPKTYMNADTVVGVNDCGRYGSQQSFGQYTKLFRDVKGSKNGGNTIWTDDDEELWRILNENVVAIEDADHIQEIYLISHDGKNRLYFRRKLVNQEWEHTRYKIQMLRLKWFDAWRLHNFDKTEEENWIRNDGLYDGVIDTWACDSSMWFIWNWPSLSWAYAEYYLPKDVDDCWIDITQWATSVNLWNISISPLGDSDLFWAEQGHQINPSMKILVVNWVYVLAYEAPLSASISNFKVPLETTINMKDFYKE